MTTLQALVLGIVQGLGEFLPISSSAHLIVVPWLVGGPNHGLPFDVSLHVGSLAAVVYALRGYWWRIISAALRGLVHGRPGEGEGRLFWLIVLASIPGAVAGLALGEAAETSFRSPLLIATTMTVIGTVLLIADRGASTGAERRQVTVLDALLIGSAEALAIVPGVSRSGATISMALFLGYRREEAARFSFLLATPIIFGAALTKVPHLLHAGQRGPILVGIAAAAIVGLAAIRILLAYVRTGDYRPFVYYRWTFAAVILVVYLLRAHLG